MLQLFHMGWLNIVNFRYLNFQTAHQRGYFEFLKPQSAGQGYGSAFEFRRKIFSDQIILWWHAGQTSGRAYRKYKMNRRTELSTVKDGKIRYTTYFAALTLDVILLILIKLVIWKYSCYNSNTV